MWLGHFCPRWVDAIVDRDSFIGYSSAPNERAFGYREDWCWRCQFRSPSELPLSLAPPREVGRILRTGLWGLSFSVSAARLAA
eukprot:11212494-Lingulodinium_polyedra.AAC.1